MNIDLVGVTFGRVMYVQFPMNTVSCPMVCSYRETQSHIIYCCFCDSSLSVNNNNNEDADADAASLSLPSDCTIL